MTKSRGRTGFCGLVVAVAIALGACEGELEPADPHSWTAVFPAMGAVKALPVAVADQTGVVIGVELSNGFASFQEGANAVAGRPNALAIGWVGGACDRQVAITVTKSGRWTVAIQTAQAAGACILVGFSRDVILMTRQPVDAAAVDVIADGRPVRR